MHVCGCTRGINANTGEIRPPRYLRSQSRDRYDARHQAASGAHNRLAVASNVPREADARQKVSLFGAVRRLTRTDLLHRRSGSRVHIGIEVAKEVVAFR